MRSLADNRAALDQVIPDGLQHARRNPRNLIVEPFSANPKMLAWQGLLDAVHDQQPVSGLTHAFYRYPARFAPSFAREIIRCFTAPGDLVLDPFMGGGTSLVEAMALGRRAAGTDISSLAVFVAQAKTTILSRTSLEKIKRWAEWVLPRLSLHNTIRCGRHVQLKAQYQRNISGRRTWPTRKLIELALASLYKLDGPAERQFARCVLLRTAQWALDCREEFPKASEIRNQFRVFLDEMILGAQQFSRAVATNGTGPKSAICLHRSAIGLENEGRIRKMGTPSLILTSPPYPGVHVLYHRWQVLGRWETPAPFWIAGALDGAGESFYTFGDRKQKSLRKYYSQAGQAFSSIGKVISRNTFVAQMVAFADPSWQLPSYLAMMEACGFAERQFPEISNAKDGRVWRSVPNRKWYADHHGRTAASKEVVLFHCRR